MWCGKPSVFGRFTSFNLFLAPENTVNNGSKSTEQSWIAPVAS